jgi:hypothetical protein
MLFHQIKKDKLNGACKEPERDEKCNIVLVRKSENKRSFVENGHKWGAMTK